MNDKYDYLMLISGMNEAIRSTDSDNLNDYLNIDDTDTGYLTCLLRDTGSYIMLKYREIALKCSKNVHMQDISIKHPECHTGASRGLYDGLTDVCPDKHENISDFCERIRSPETDHFEDFTPDQQTFIAGMYMIYTAIETEKGYLLPCQKHLKTVDELVSSIKEYLRRSILESIEDTVQEYMEKISYYNYYGYMPES